MFNKKESFIESISDQFIISANWRKAQAKRFYHDQRNEEAAKRLLELESQIEIPDDVWQQLEPLVSESVRFAAVSETNRAVGFRKHPRDFAAWLENLLSNLTMYSVAA